jgi:RHS repeat-associated protein
MTSKGGWGGAPTMNASYDANNHQIGMSYDANGNEISVNGSAIGYSVENKMTSELSNYWPWGGSFFGYDPQGKRVMKETNPDPQNYEGDYNPLWEFYFYGITGQKLVTVDCNNPNGNGVPSCWMVGQNVYFGSKLLVSNGVYVVTDRLGSVRANTQGEKFSYYPYGEERTVTPDGREKFGTYFRDSVGQDYAGQRYYNGGMGRFWNPDPAGVAAANPSSPGSWNGYAYTKGDPVNQADPSGMFGSDPPTAQDCINDPDDPACYGPCGTGGLPTASQALFRVLHPEFAMDAGCGPEPVGGGDGPGDGGETGCAYPGVTGDSGLCYLNVRSTGAGWTSFAKTVGSLFSKLAKDTKCIDWLGGNTPTGEAAVELFMSQSVSKNFSIADSIISPVNSDGAPVYAGTINGTTNDNVPNAAAIVINWGTFQGNSVKGQFLVLLHEMAHFFNVAGFNVNDATPGLQLSNNSQVYANCGKTVN